MPVTPTYPGVYVEEIPSGVRTITGVATSITAFVGWAAKGPTDRAQLVLSWADYERKFGGLDMSSLMSYGVYQFFANGGQRAYIVRVVSTDGADADKAAAASVKLDGKLTVTASSPGAWANDYAIVTTKRAAPNDKRFRLVVANFKLDKKGVPVETFENLSMDPQDPRFVVGVLESESSLVVAKLEGTPTEPPKDTEFKKPSNPPADPPDPDIGAILKEAQLTGGNSGKAFDQNDPKFDLAILPASGSGGVYYLDRIDLFNLLCVPGETNPALLKSLEAFCRERRAFLIADSAHGATFDSLTNGPDGNLTGADAINAAFYFPWLKAPDPLQENRLGDFPPSGFVAGLYARTDTNRGVWKAPAGTEASLNGALGTVKPYLTDDENGVLNPKAVNCIRTFPVYGTIVWGARTLQGNDEVGSEWKYIPVRRTALFIEESLFRALKWVVFEPNDEPLWAQIRLNVGAFMHDLFRQGAFQGSTPRDAYFVKCDKETTTQSDINRGIVNIVVGFAPLKPAEFVIIKIQQIAGQIEV